MARVITVHALPNALPPIINMVVLLIANFMVGAFIVEQIFSYPGIGKMMIAAVKFRDIPLVLAIGIVFAVLRHVKSAGRPVVDAGHPETALSLIIFCALIRTEDKYCRSGGIFDSKTFNH